MKTWHIRKLQKNSHKKEDSRQTGSWCLLLKSVNSVFWLTLECEGEKTSQTQLGVCRYLTSCKEAHTDHILPCNLNSYTSNTPTEHLHMHVPQITKHTHSESRYCRLSSKVVPSCLSLPQMLTHNGPSCMSQHQLKPQLQLQHTHPQPQHPRPQPPLHHPHPHPHAVQHPQCHGPLMDPGCNLAPQQTLSSSQSGSVITQAPSTLTHSGWVSVHTHTL